MRVAVPERGGRAASGGVSGMLSAETRTGAFGAGVLRITLQGGQFRIETPDGIELTPTGAKAQGLLALVATDRHLRRGGRVWLIDKLWSDRAQPQGQASLRQALVEIRKALGPPWAEAFLTDRRAVALDPDMVEVATEEGGAGGGGVFLEGIDIRDPPEFEDWLRQMRAATEADSGAGGSGGGLILPAVQPTARPQLVLEAHSRPGEAARDTEDWFIDVLFRTLGEQFTYDIHFQMPEQAPPPGGLVQMKVQSFAQGPLAGAMRVVVVEMPGGRTLWTETLRPPGGGEEGTVALYALSHRALRAVSDGLRQASATQPGDPDANHLAAQALQNMFSMRGEALETADRQLVAALALEERGVFHAWRAQLAAIRHIEQTGRDRDELDALSRAAGGARALELECQNSSVLSGVANARLVLEGDGIAAGNLAQAGGVDANPPANPLAWWALANARLYSGQAEDAWQAAVMSQRLAAKSNFRFWTDFQVSLVAAVTGRTREAIDFGELSGALAPNFRPPMRYLTALYAAQGGDRENATRAARQLTLREPGFTLDKLLNDPPNYPVSMMRQAGLLDRARLSELDL